MEIDLRKILILVFVHGQRFENVEHGAMYSHIFTDDTLMCHRNIYQVLKHVSVVSFPNIMICHQNLYIYQV